VNDVAPISRGTSVGCKLCCFDIHNKKLSPQRKSHIAILRYLLTQLNNLVESRIRFSTQIIKCLVEICSSSVSSSEYNDTVLIRSCSSPQHPLKICVLHYILFVLCDTLWDNHAFVGQQCDILWDNLQLLFRIVIFCEIIVQLLLGVKFCE
jgi:hypothetical protein